MGHCAPSLWHWFQVMYHVPCHSANNNMLLLCCCCKQQLRSGHGVACRSVTTSPPMVTTSCLFCCCCVGLRKQSQTAVLFLNDRHRRDQRRYRALSARLRYSFSISSVNSSTGAVKRNINQKNDATASGTSVQPFSSRRHVMISSHDVITAAASPRLST